MAQYLIGLIMQDTIAALSIEISEGHIVVTRRRHFSGALWPGVSADRLRARVLGSRGVGGCAGPGCAAALQLPLRPQEHCALPGSLAALPPHPRRLRRPGERPAGATNVEQGVHVLLLGGLASSLQIEISSTPPPLACSLLLRAGSRARNPFSQFSHILIGSIISHPKM